MTTLWSNATAAIAVLNYTVKMVAMSAFHSLKHSYPSPTPSRSVEKELEAALTELFLVLGLSVVKVENDLEIQTSNFIGDIKKVKDEIKDHLDIVRLWHFSDDLAENVFSVINEVLFSSDDTEYMSTEEEANETDDEEDNIYSESDSDIELEVSADECSQGPLVE